MTTTAAPIGEPIAGRYVPLRVLKSGEGVRTVLARDARDGADVVVKSVELATVDDATRRRFEHETQILRTLVGLGLPGLRDAGEDDGRLYLTQPYLRGETLETLLRGGPLAVSRALRVALGVASVLEVAHSAGICHRDVKPANILVDGPPQNPTVSLVDFGLARSAELDATVSTEVVGTIRYLAPEAAGLLSGVPADERSDLYALGIVLFECLVGRPPFAGPTVSDLLRQHLSAAVPPARGEGREVPRAVEALVHRLLRKDPSERYQSAAALAADLSALVGLIESGNPDPSFVIGRLDRRRGLTDPPFVGRAAELAKLTEVVDGVPEGHSAAVLLEADSGGGKTRLLQEVVQHALQRGMRVLRGQGVALAGQRPFAMLQGMAEELASTLDDDEQQALRDALDDSAPSAARALPALEQLLQTSADLDTGPEEFGELRSMAALGKLIGALARADRPLLLVLDDCQWGDTLTVRLIHDLFTAAPPHLGVILSFRADEVPRSHALRRIPHAKPVRLGPLDRDALVLLVESMAGPVPRVALEIVLRLADGNPFMAAAVLRGMVETGALLAEDDGWTVDPDRLEDVQAARRSAAFLVRRLELLPDHALRLLSVGAVLGKQFDLQIADEVAGHPADAADILERARRSRLLWIDEENGRWRFFHDKIREALIDRLDADARRELHSRAADALATRAGQDRDAYVFDLAYHLDAAGRYADALPYALAGAALARERYALDTAIAHYRMAERAVTDADVATRVVIAEGLGDVLTLQGVYVEAQQQVLLARSLVTDAAHASALEGKLGELAFKTGNIVDAKAHLQGALRGLGRSAPRSNAGFFVRVLWEALVQAVHTIFPRWTVGRRAGKATETDFLAMRHYSRLAYLYWFHSGRIPCAWAHLRGMNLAERYGPSAELGQAYSEHAPVMTTLPWYSRGKRYAQRSYDIRRDLGDVWGQGQSLGFTATVLYAAGEWTRAREVAEQAITLLQRTGDQWEVNTARWHVALSLWRAGRLQESADVGRDNFRAAAAIGDLTSAGISLSVWTRSELGAVDLRLITEQLARGNDDAHTSAELHLAAGLAHRRAGDLTAAERSMRNGLRVVHDATLRHDYVAPLFPWYATVLRERAEALPTLAPRARRRALRQAARAARRARSWARSYRNNAPHALRESGLIAALRGRETTARRRLVRSLEIAEEQGANYEAAQSRLALATLDAAHDRTADVDDARLALAVFESGGAAPGSAATLSVSDRFASLLTVGRAIAAAASYPQLELAIRDAARALLRVEDCHLIPIALPLDGSFASLSGRSIDGLSRVLVSEALAQSAPVASSDLPEETNESLVIAGVRSALAAPITVSGRPTSCLYVTHHEVGHLFGEEEVQLASFIATLAGAAYEHLAGNETRFRSLVQNSTDVITLVDPDGLVSYQSSAIASEFGYPAAGFVGSSVVGWVHPDDVAEFTDALGGAHSSSELRVQCRLRHVDGEYRVCETTMTDLLDEPTIGAIVLTTRDITERTRYEQELVEKNAALEKASQAKDMFLASMSHELRTPLNAIMGFTGALLMELAGPLNDEQARQLTTVEHNGAHLLSIINDLLDLARIESGQVQLVLADVDCTAVVADVVQRLEPLASAKHLALTCAAPDGPVLCDSDERALSQIMINLVNNAIKFTDTGGVHVSVTRADDGVRVDVADTGIGIESTDLERIFTAFARAKDNSRRQREGTGLGLHISQKLAELIGARLEIQTEVDRGTTFSVFLHTTDVRAREIKVDA